MAPDSFASSSEFINNSGVDCGILPRWVQELVTNISEWLNKLKVSDIRFIDDVSVPQLTFPNGLTFSMFLTKYMIFRKPPRI